LEVAGGVGGRREPADVAVEGAVGQGGPVGVAPRYQAGTAQRSARCWTSERKRRPSIGLHTNQVAPARRASSRSSWRSEEVSTTTGRVAVASSARIRRST